MKAFSIFSKLLALSCLLTHLRKLKTQGHPKLQTTETFSPLHEFEWEKSFLKNFAHRNYRLGLWIIKIPLKTVTKSGWIMVCARALRVHGLILWVSDHERASASCCCWGLLEKCLKRLSSANKINNSKSPRAGGLLVDISDAGFCHFQTSFWSEWVFNLVPRNERTAQKMTFFRFKGI